MRSLPCSSPLFDAARRACVGLPGRPSPRQRPEATARRSGQGMQPLAQHFGEPMDQMDSEEDARLHAGLLDKDWQALVRNH